MMSARTNDNLNKLRLSITKSQSKDQTEDDKKFEQFSSQIDEYMTKQIK